MLAALVIRLPYIQEVPRFTDELQEILWALAIYRGEIRPLTAVDSYYGPVWSYLLAGTFYLESLGADISELPRLLATALAVATVGVTYGVAREFGGRRVAVIAAALLATSGGHVIINSHTGRSNSITPLLTTLLVWAVVRAVRSGNGRLLVLAGFLGAVALQTHISVIAYAAGPVVWIALARPRLLASRWTVLAILAFLLGYANMIAFNLENGLWSFIHARALQQGYADGHSTDLPVYLTNLSALIESLSRLASGTIDEAGNPAAWVYLFGGLAGLVWLARRGSALPLLFCLSGALVLPYFNPRYGPILSGRYIVPLLPFLYIGVGLALERLVSLVPLLAPRATSAVRLAVVRAIVAAVVLFPLAPLGLYYQEVLADARTNRPLFHLSETLGDSYQAGDLVLVDEALAQEALTAGGTDLKAMRVLLEADGIPYQVAKVSGSGLAPAVSAHPRVLVVMNARKADQLGKRLRAESMGPKVGSASGSGHTYAVFEVRPREAGPSFAEHDDVRGRTDDANEASGESDSQPDPDGGLEGEEERGV
jgi:hypothetical protein